MPVFVKVGQLRALYMKTYVRFCARKWLIGKSPPGKVPCGESSAVEFPGHIQRSNSCERARIVTRCVHFLICSQRLHSLQLGVRLFLDHYFDSSYVSLHIIFIGHMSHGSKQDYQRTPVP